MHEHKEEKQNLCIFRLSVYRTTSNRTVATWHLLDLRVGHVVIVYDSDATSGHHWSNIAPMLSFISTLLID